ncbi:MAG: hypothetical protein WKG07_46090 [Hymenobacter sp.]
MRVLAVTGSLQRRGAERSGCRGRRPGALDALQGGDQVETAHRLDVEGVREGVDQGDATSARSRQRPAGRCRGPATPGRS